MGSGGYILGPKKTTKNIQLVYSNFKTKFRWKSMWGYQRDHLEQGGSLTTRPTCLVYSWLESWLWLPVAPCACPCNFSKPPDLMISFSGNDDKRVRCPSSPSPSNCQLIICLRSWMHRYSRSVYLYRYVANKYLYGISLLCLAQSLSSVLP